MAKKTIFIAGNTKGTHEGVINRFHAMIDKLQHEIKATKIHTPTVLAEPKATWSQSIRSDITALMTCDELHMMNNWQGHKRSEILRDTANRVGIHVVYH
jgi:hypothetical protein